MESISKKALEINRLAPEYAFGGLQQLRKQLRGLANARSVIFDISKQSVNEKEGWAFHTGGREELQFNIGFEMERDRFRFGVAFSLEPSRSFTTIDPLLPKITRFNEYLRNNSKNFHAYRMWVWSKKRLIKEDTAVREITEDEIAMPNFIFLGKSVPISRIDVSEVLNTFDELLPMYSFVESGILSVTDKVPLAKQAFSFREGVTFAANSFSSRSPQGKISVVFRSDQIKRKLCDQLKLEIGTKIGDENPSGNGGRIDLVAALANGFYEFYEIKPALLARHAIREALPQLLEYAYRRGGHEATKLIIASDAPLDDDSEEFLSKLRSRGLPLFYQCVPLD